MAERRTGPSSSGKCRSCGAAVEWLPHVRTKLVAPIQVPPIGSDVKCNILVTADGEYFIVEPGAGEAINHFAVCANAATHHKAAG